MEVVVRPSKASEIPEILSLRRDPDVCRHQYAINRFETPERFARKLKGKPDRLGVCFRCSSVLVDGELVGHVLQHFGPGSDVDRRACDCGWNLKPSAWGKGIMPRALRLLFAQLFEENPKLVIYASCFESNRRSRRVMEKLGFEPDRMGFLVGLVHFLRARGKTVLQYRLDRRAFRRSL